LLNLIFIDLRNRNINKWWNLYLFDIQELSYIGVRTILIQGNEINQVTEM